MASDIQTMQYVAVLNAISADEYHSPRYKTLTNMSFLWFDYRCALIFCGAFFRDVGTSYSILLMSFCFLATQIPIFYLMGKFLMRRKQSDRYGTGTHGYLFPFDMKKRQKSRERNSFMFKLWLNLTKSVFLTFVM